MEDTKDKLRRNLVVFSGLFSVGAFLNIDPSSASPWVPELLKGVDYLRLQVVFLAILIYLSFRWYSSEEQRREFAKLREFWFASMEKLSRSDGLRALENLQEKDYPNKQLNWLAANRGRNRDIERKFDNLEVVGWMRTLRIHYTLMAAGPHVSGAIDRAPASFSFSLPIRAWMARQLACFFASLKSEHFWEWAAPLFMSYVALLIIARRLAWVLLF